MDGVFMSFLSPCFFLTKDWRWRGGGKERSTKETAFYRLKHQLRTVVGAIN